MPTRRSIASLLSIVVAALVLAPSAGASPKGPTISVATANSYAKKGVAKLNLYLAVPRRGPTHEDTYWETTSIIKSLGPCKQRGRRTGMEFECPMEFYDAYRKYAADGGEFIEEVPFSLLRKGRLYVAVGPHQPEKVEDIATFPLAKGYEVGVGYYV